MSLNVSNFPLCAYKNQIYYTMRINALERYSGPLEQRFSRDQFNIILEQTGLEGIKLSANEPFWCAVGYRCSKEKAIG